MPRWILVLASFTVCLLVLLWVPTASAQSPSAHAVRAGAEMKACLTHGEAFIDDRADSPQGIRLYGKGGIATAIYRIDVPAWSNHLRLNIRYRDLSGDDEIAARLWIKTPCAAAGTQKIDQDQGDTPMYGDTFILRSDRSSEIIIIPTHRYIKNNIIEIHAIAQGGDAVDLAYIHCEHLTKTPVARIIHRVVADYWERWPRHQYIHHYLYLGPIFWPCGALVYERWEVPLRPYWTRWRPWFCTQILPLHHRHVAYHHHYRHMHSRSPGTHR